MRIVDGQSRTTYRVRWEIDIDAASPLQAAQRAQAEMWHRGENNLATVFQVYERREPVKMEEIDLACICDSQPEALDQRQPCPAHSTREKLTNA